jgi:cytoskeletal protein RodZ
MADNLHIRVGDQGDDRIGSRVGALLRTAREATGNSLQSVSQQLRIRAVYLRAIEEGDFGALPGTTYAIGFVRSYADFLGLDGPDIVRRFREEVEELGRRTQLVFPVTPAEGKIPGGAIMLIAILIAGLVYGTWIYMSDRERSLAGLIPEVPAELKNMLGRGSPPPAETQSATAGDANPTIQTPAPPPPSAGEAASAPPPATGPVETTAGVSTTADEQAAASITMSPLTPPSTMPGADEDEVPPAPDDADGTADSALGTADQEIVEAPPLNAPPTPTPTITTPATPTTAPAASGNGLANAAAAAAAATATPSASTPSASTTAASATTQQAASNAPPPPPAAPLVPEDSLPKGQDYGVTNGDTRVVLVARQEVWVQVSSPTQEVWTRVLRPGDRYLVPNDASLTLATGNAGGLDIMVDGRKTPSLGPVGVVRRNISLDPSKLLGVAIP